MIESGYDSVSAEPGDEQDGHGDDEFWRPGDADGNRAPVEETASENLGSIAVDHEAPDQHPYVALTPDAIIEAIESAGLVSDARVFALNSYENRVYQCGLENDEPVIAKFYRPERWSREQIQEEHDFTAFLNQLDVPVVAPIRSEDGQTIHFAQGFMFALFPRQGGRAPELDNLTHLEQLGQFIGRLHAAGESFRFGSRISLSVQRMGHESVGTLLGYPMASNPESEPSTAASRSPTWIPEDLRDAYTSVTGQILAVLESAGLEEHSFISLHGDCHPGNVLWREERPHFVDFDDAISGPAIQDLWMLLSGQRHQQLAQLDVIAKGYEKFMPFPAGQLRLIEPLRAMRVLHYNAWLARRWSDPAFPLSFPWFNSQRYWSEHILELKELYAALHEPPLELV